MGTGLQIRGQSLFGPQMLWWGLFRSFCLFFDIPLGVRCVLYTTYTFDGGIQPLLKATFRCAFVKR